MNKTDIICNINLFMSLLLAEGQIIADTGDANQSPV